VKKIEHPERRVSEDLVGVCLNPEPTDEEPGFISDEIIKYPKMAMTEISQPDIVDN
jgi:hypothetical protein